jgi:glycosyltransferase involved in cell wall biosynthesis
MPGTPGTVSIGNIPPGPILRGGRSTKRKTRKLKRISPTIKGTTWPAGSIVYLCGKSKVTFGPKDTDLGGSEQAVVQLSKRWAAAGRPVVVYGNVHVGEVDGVHYRDLRDFHLADSFDTVIFWRSYGVRLLPLVKAKHKYVDLHDAWDPKEYVHPDTLLNEVDKFFVKSKYHRDLYDYIPDSKIVNCMNGIQMDIFEGSCKKVQTREPHRLIYASSYDRGLLPLLQHTWPRIIKAIPDAEIHIFYGFTIKGTPDGKKLAKLFKQKGVFEHGRVSHSEVAKQKCMSAIHLYVSNSVTEIDCISVRESLVCGAVPILGNDYVFKERDGVHVSGSTKLASTYQKTASVVIDLLNDQEKLANTREELKKSDTILSWDTVAEKWLKIIG